MLGTIQTSSWEKTREHYCLAAADNDYKRSKAISNAPSLVTVFTNTEALLELKAFNPSDLVQVALKGDKTGKLKKLAHRIKKFQEQTGLSCKFTKKFQHYSSFLGRYFN
ncbi:unnamed protein product [Rhizopus microsporus]